MIILDTNVLSELARPRPSDAVVAWLDEQDADEIRLTAICVAELRAGVALLPSGRRRRIAAVMESLVNETFSGRVLAFDVASTSLYADVVARRRRAGRPIGSFDAQLAAISRQHAAVLATRNTRDFEGAGVELINPWEAPPRRMTRRV